MEREPGLSRREFLRCSALLAGRAVLDSILPKPASELNLSPEPINREARPTLALKKDSAEKSFESFLITALETSGMMGVNFGVLTGLESLGVETGNKPAEKRIRTEGVNLSCWLGGVLISPCYEELVFRWWPKEMFSKEKINYGVAAISSLAFALVHNLDKEDGEEGESRIIVHRSVPVPQFLFAIFSWSLMERRGIIHSIFGHCLYNFLGFSLLTLHHHIKKTNQVKDSGKES